MSIQAYADTLAAIQTRFFQYRGDFPALAENIRRQICRSVLTKGRIFNFTPYAAERLGSRRICAAFITETVVLLETYLKELGLME